VSSPGPRTAIVTGASSGIGAATAVELGRGGWRVAIGARRVDRLETVAKEVEAAGGAAFAKHLDVTDPESVDAFCTAAESAFGPIDLLVNNAGQNMSAKIAEATADELRLDVEVNLLGAMFVTRRVVPGMIARRVGDVIFVGSDAAVRPRTYQGAYNAAKAGLEAFARVLAMETEGTGVRSILIRVGPTWSEFNSQMPHDRLPEILQSWKQWGVLRSLHAMKSESAARAIVRAIAAPVEESYTTVIEVQPGGRSKEYAG
jgi:NADP-dependent 3-hydroxy acid dehydrogenase YdfG